MHCNDSVSPMYCGVRQVNTASPEALSFMLLTFSYIVFGGLCSVWGKNGLKILETRCLLSSVVLLLFMLVYTTFHFLCALIPVHSHREFGVISVHFR